MDRGSETQIYVGKKYFLFNCIMWRLKGFNLPTQGLHHIDIDTYISVVESYYGRIVQIAIKEPDVVHSCTNTGILIHIGRGTTIDVHKDRLKSHCFYAAKKCLNC